jgi:hypothetical protein
MIAFYVLLALVILIGTVIIYRVVRYPEIGLKVPVKLKSGAVITCKIIGPGKSKAMFIAREENGTQFAVKRGPIPKPGDQSTWFSEA